MEISGATAMWTRPDTGDTPVSYPVPTFAAVKGIFECVLLSQWANVVPTKVEICSPIVYHDYTTNYGGPLRKPELVKAGNNYQFFATVLVNVCYRLYAVVNSDPRHYSMHGRPGLQSQGTTNGAHAYQSVFSRRIDRDQLHYTPCLGWKEFVPDYVGRFRPETMVFTDIDLVIPSMLRTCFPSGKGSDWKPVFDQQVRIEKGVLHYSQ
ncbi:MAG: CRISPR-associated protein Cas5 [Eubacteriales bacterium]|nr:CRISPR-associated protein Cas5 [Eubacteriales bacterium]MDZ7610058.1 CRISPR-associated protein Cas5 [Eubacteriales bacterium]